MSYGRYPYGGVGYAGSTSNAGTDTKTALSVEVAFTTGALAEPVWEDVTSDVRSWETMRGRNRELERFQPGRATIVLANREAQYDSMNTGGPHYGFIKPMKRIRIRETFNGVTYPVFDGFVDRWQLDYPGTNKDAVAVVTATEAFKIFARTDLPLSVYHDVVLEDSPAVYLRLDESKSDDSDGNIRALNYGALGSAADGLFVGPPELGQEAQIVKDPGSSIRITNQIAVGAVTWSLQGAELDNAGIDLFASAPFALEVWCTPQGSTDPAFSGALMKNGDGSSSFMEWAWDSLNQQFLFAVVNTTPSSFLVSSTAGGSLPFKRYHVVAKFVNGSPLLLWVNGVQFSGTTPSGSFTAGHDTHVGHNDSNPNVSWNGLLSHAAIYTGANATAVDQAWVDRHYAAGTAPLDGDLPGARIGRYLDEAEWPTSLRELDAGVTTFQSDEWGTDVLEKLQKASESEYGALLFVARDGRVRFIGRTGVFAREPYPIPFGDNAGEIGYTGFTPDDGDEVIRNRATISRLNGVAKSAVDGTSVDEFGRFDFVLEGLLHDSEAVSQSYANIIVSEYADPRRRITKLELGPPIVGDEDIHYPGVLGLELGDAITVKNTPLGGEAFTQVCVIEGIEHSSSPGGVHETVLVLSPELTDQTF